MTRVPPVCRFRIAGRLALALLDAWGADAVYSPWRTVYIRRQHYGNEALRAHEIQHALQRHRDGFFVFWWCVVYYLVRFGYQNSPYEIEARAAADSVVRRTAQVDKLMQARWPDPCPLT